MAGSAAIAELVIVPLGGRGRNPEPVGDHQVIGQRMQSTAAWVLAKPRTVKRPRPRFL